MVTPLLRTCYFLLLLLLCMIDGNFGREIAKEVEQNIQTANEKDDADLCVNHAHTKNHHHHGCQKEMTHNLYQPMHAHTSSPSSSSSSSTSSSSHMDHMDLSWNIFFHIDDLKVGNKIPLYFPIKNSSLTPHMIPKKEAESIPFTSSQLPKILEFFSFSHDSPQAKAIQHTLMHCELPPLEGETKFCATSLESMLENLGQIFEKGNNFKVLTTTHVKKMMPYLQNYTILEDIKEISAPKIVGCHPVPYPYAVYYCHGQVSDNRLFLISLESEMDSRLRVEAVAMCHMDTSKWDPRHVSFRMLGIEPGTSPVCHVFPQDNLVWVAPPSSSAN